MSIECTLVLEDNACAYTCNVGVPLAKASEFVGTLNSLAAEQCDTCSPLDRPPCVTEMAYCFGGGCVDLPNP
jgi:hypothetical protein